MMPLLCPTAYVVHSWNCDHLGHLNVRHYAAAFDDAIFAFWARAGLRPASDSAVPVTVDIRIGFRAEALAGMVAQIRPAIARLGGKSVGLHFDMHDTATGALLAECDVTEVFIATADRHSCPIPTALRDRLIQASPDARG